LNRTLVGLLMLTLLLPTAAATDEGGSMNSANDYDENQEAAPNDSPPTPPETCIFIGPLCIPSPVCLGRGGGDGSAPVDTADRGIGIVVATSYNKGDEAWEDYYGGAVLCH
jgi:hypothetical protein